MTAAVLEVNLPGIPLYRRGKVRDTFDLGDRLLMVATDRISAFDVVMPNAVPGKGEILTQLSAFWFRQTEGLVPNHVVAVGVGGVDDISQESQRLLARRSLIVRKAERIDVECVVRGYLAGSAWNEYVSTGCVAGMAMPSGLRRADRLQQPLFTPAAKSDDGHDRNLSLDEFRSMLEPDIATALKRYSLALYVHASGQARSRGLILADTKFEFGLIDGQLTLIDELLTPDSSRYWDAATYRPGTNPESFDKQYLRDWLLASDWNQQPPGPALPESVVRGTLDRYVEAFERLTETTWERSQEAGISASWESLREIAQ